MNRSTFEAIHNDMLQVAPFVCATIYSLVLRRRLVFVLFFFKLIHFWFLQVVPPTISGGYIITFDMVGTFAWLTEYWNALALLVCGDKQPEGG